MSEVLAGECPCRVLDDVAEVIGATVAVQRAGAVGQQLADDRHALYRDGAGGGQVAGPVPVRGVAIISQLLTDGTGPLYYQGCADDLSDIIENASQALAR